MADFCIFPFIPRLRSYDLTFAINILSSSISLISGQIKGRRCPAMLSYGTQIPVDGNILSALQDTVALSRINNSPNED